MITIYPSDCTDFGTNGLGILYPNECIVKEIEGGMYELSMEHPIDDTLRWAQITNGCIIKAPVPMRESPMYEIEAFEGESGETVTKTVKIYQVKTSTGQRLNLRKAASLNAKILGSYKPGTKVTRLKTSGNWMKVTVRKGGATGWMWAANLDYVQDVTETITKAKPVTREGVKVEPSREQLFRIVNVEQDTENAVVRVDAQHVFYDIKGNILDGDYEPKNVAANTAVTYITGHLLNTLAPFEIFTPNLTDKITGEYSYKNLVEILCDPDEGIVAQTKGMLVRDGFDVYVLPDQTRDMGVTVRRGKNLIGVTVTTDASNVVTRIIPVGKDKKGNDLFVTPRKATKYRDSAHINDYPVIYAQRIDYPVKLVDKKADGEETFTNVNTARDKLWELAGKDFEENGVDLPSYGMEVDFVTLADAEGYEDYAGLQAVHLHDTVTVIDSLIGLYAKLRVTGYEYDALAQQYTKITLGDVENVQQTVYSYNLPTGGISGTKIANNSLGGNAIRSMSIDYAKISNAAITNLMADSLTAVNANIQNLTAGRINTDELYASMAQMASAIVTDASIASADIGDLAAQVAEIAQAIIDGADIEEANIGDANVQTLAAALAQIMALTAQSAEIEAANIDWAHIANLTAQAETVAQSNIGSAAISYANIDWADIKTLATALANINTARMQQATIDQADIDTLNAGIADVLTITAQHGDFEFATVQRLLASSFILEQGIGDTLFIKNLSATSAMFVQATLGELCLKGDDGKYYDVSVAADGTIHTQDTGYTDADIIAGVAPDGKKVVVTEAAIDELNSTNIRAESLIVSEIFAAALTADVISAGQAFIASATIPELYVTAITAIGETLTLTAGQINMTAGGTLEDYEEDIAADIDGLSSDLTEVREVAEGAAGAIRSMAVGGVNLVDDSALIAIAGTDDPETSYRELASGLLPGMAYTLSMESATLTAGSAAGMTLEAVRLPDADQGETEETILLTDTLDFSGGHQKYTFVTADDGHTYALRIYAGIKGAGNGRVVELEKVKLERGTFATMWTESLSDAEARLVELSSQLSVTASGLSSIVTHVTQDVDGTIRNVNDYFRFDGSDPNNPKLILGTDTSPMTMELTNSRLSFLWHGDAVAYFSNNKLYVTNVEAIERMSIGTDSNGFLDIVTTATGVGFIWRS